MYMSMHFMASEVSFSEKMKNIKDTHTVMYIHIYRSKDIESRQ